MLGFDAEVNCSNYSVGNCDHFEESMCRILVHFGLLFTKSGRDYCTCRSGEQLWVVMNGGGVYASSGDGSPGEGGVSKHCSFQHVHADHVHAAWHEWAI